VKEKLVLLGGGGHCKSCIDVIQEEGRFEIVGIVEGVPTSLEALVITAKAGIPSHSVLGYPVIGTDADLPELVKKYRNFLITVGQISKPAVRIKLYETIRSLGGHLPVIVSPHAYVSRSALIGAGTIVMHNVVVNAEAHIGVNCILNTGALIEHEAITGDHCHISTYAILNGQCTVGSRTFIGSRTVLANNISIPDDTLVSAGSVVLRTLEQPGTYIGNPLRKIR
jgi:sugar O-acyltransferase (sialic acid O-acetyltransferase NeuD family)